MIGWSYYGNRLLLDGEDELFAIYIYIAANFYLRLSTLRQKNRPRHVNCMIVNVS